MKKETKATKLKIAGITALVAGVLAAGGIAYSNFTNSDKDSDKKLEINASKLTVKQMQDFIHESDIALARLQGVIDSDTANPEEKFEARRAYNNISVERDKMRNELQKRQQKTINFDTIRTTSNHR